MKIYTSIITILLLSSCRSAPKSSNHLHDTMQNAKEESHFRCMKQGEQRYRPYYMKWDTKQNRYIDYSKTAKGLLGQNAMRSEEECQQALEAARHDYGVICSRTGLDGWKPTIYTGTKPGRADFGYLGGSSIMKFENCLTATSNASAKGVCFWGGSQWYRSYIDRSGVSAGPFSSVERCIESTRELPTEEINQN